MFWKLYLLLDLTQDFISYGWFLWLRACLCSCICISAWVCSLLRVLCDSSSPCSIMSWCYVFRWTLFRVKGYLCDERPTWGWLDTRAQLFIRPPTGFCLSACIWLFVRVCTCNLRDAVLYPCELSQVNDIGLQGILPLFVLLPPQGPPLVPISFHFACPVRWSCTSHLNSLDRWCPHPDCAVYTI